MNIVMLKNVNTSDSALSLWESFKSLIFFLRNIFNDFASDAICIMTVYSVISDNVAIDWNALTHNGKGWIFFSFFSSHASSFLITLLSCRISIVKMLISWSDVWTSTPHSSSGDLYNCIRNRPPKIHFSKTLYPFCVLFHLTISYFSSVSVHICTKTSAHFFGQ